MLKKLDRTEPAAKVGIVHLGIGAFFRAHGAIYIKEAMEHSGGDWGVVGVSLRSSTVRDKLAPQDYVYTAVEVSENGLRPQEIDVVTNILVAPEDPSSVLQLMASSQTSVVSMTVTEKGYCRGAGSSALDLENPDIKHDIINPSPRTAPGFLVRALEMRKQNGLRPFTVLCMDNLPANGHLTKQIVIEFATEIDKDLANWIDTECRFPSTMVDRIVPATTLEFVARLQQECEIDDPATVSHEPFRQWVIEDSFVDNIRPNFEAAGAQLVNDVEPFEHMKLRMLNGTHSALAYMGSLAGFETVSDAINDTSISTFINDMWRDEIAPSLQSPPNTNLTVYAQQLKTRYQNPEIRHLLEQIAMDGSQKLPQRILDPLFENLAAGVPYKRLLTVIAAWISYLQTRVSNTASPTLSDPMASELIAALSTADSDQRAVTNILNIGSVFGNYPTPLIADDLVINLQNINTHGIANSIKGIVK